MIKYKKRADKWFQTEKAASGTKTKELYHRLVYKHILPAVGDVRLKELRKSDIDFDKNVIRVRNTDVFLGSKAILKPVPKSEASIRNVPMPKILRMQLDTFWKKIVNKLNIAAGVICSKKGTVFSIKNRC